jgi:diguanylate cyclase (GGDEF)-like protein
VGRGLADVLGADDHARSQPWVQRALAGEVVQFERVNESRDHGRVLALSYTPLWLDGGVVDGFIGVGQDITQHRQEQIRLLDLSERDPLTGLLNRAGFVRRIRLEIEQGRGATLAMLYIDLDHFKPVNDQHGHPVGDLLLQAFAQRLLALVRPTDVVARLGGDEFAVLLFGVREGHHAHGVADKVIAAAHAPFDIDGRALGIGASVGAAFGADTDTGWHGLVARADAQLYRAKEAGRGQQAGATDFAPLGQADSAR